MHRGYFPEGFIDRVAAATDVVAVIGRYTTLKQKGQRFFGLCPFHKEKTPSFSVDPVQGLYYCFGCHAGGSVFTFLMEKEGMTFPDAVRFLARESGIELPKTEGAGKSTEGLVDAVEFGAKFFRKALESEIGVPAREYLEKRGISPETWRNFSIGWAPANQLHLPSSVNKARKKPEPFIETGILGRSASDGRLFSLIFDALVFPIQRPGGSTVGFAHRKIVENERYTGPKYINSADNDLYKKSFVLYGLPQARSSIRSEGKAILVEGYFDVLALADRGVKNVVATCGTALTRAQANILSRYGKRVVALFDGDEAGQKATLRSMEILLSAGIDLYIGMLPAEDDPDSFVRERGSDDLMKLLNTAPGWFDWLFDYACNLAGGLNAPIASIVVEAMCAPLSSVADELAKEIYIRELAKRLGTSEEVLRERLRAEYRRRRTADREQSPAKEEELPDEARLELAVVATILRCDDPQEYPQNPLTLFPGIWESAVAGVDVSEILAEIGDTRARSCLSKIMFEPEPTDAATHLKSLIKKIERAKIDRKILELNSALRSVEHEGSAERTNDIMVELTAIRDELRGLCHTGQQSRNGRQK